MSAKTLVLVILSLAVGVLVGRFVLSDSDSGADLLQKPLEPIDEYAFPVSQILVPITDERPERQAHTLIRLAHEQLLEGVDFADVARRRSDAESAKEGGFIGFVTPSRDSTFTGVVLALRPGQVSPPIRTQKAWMIAKRHTFEEGLALEREYFIPIHGFVVGFGNHPEGGGRTREEAFAEANKARDEYVQGTMTIGEAITRYMPRARIGKDGFMRLAPRRPDSEEAWKALAGKKPGTVSDPVEMESGWAVFVLGRYMRGLVKHLVVQHVRSRNRDMTIARTPDQAKAIAEKALKEVLAKPGTWAAVVAKYSDDKTSSSDGGTLGLLAPGMMPEGFEKVIYDLEPGEICDQVVETPFGYHLVYRVR